jgi:hypothetical protein
MSGQEKICFFIAPIDEPGSEIRRRSDQILRHIIKPVVEQEYDYRALRADQLPEPGLVTDQVVQHLIDDDLVIADLTDRNPNVFYELAVRHAARKPVIAMIAADQPIPFDVSQSRTIKFDYHDLDSVAACKEELRAQIRSVRQDSQNTFTPISSALDLRALVNSGDPSEQRDAQIISLLRSLQFEVRELENRIYSPRTAPFDRDRETTIFHVGDTIRHTKFGVGHVLESGPGKIVVKFDEVDEKRIFVPEIAPLSLITDAVD